MTYQLPQFDLSYGTEDGPIHYYTADQMQAAYQAGRDSMKAECQQECSAEATDNGTAQRIAKAIEELK